MAFYAVISSYESKPSSLCQDVHTAFAANHDMIDHGDFHEGMGFFEPLCDAPVGIAGSGITRRGYARQQSCRLGPAWPPREETLAESMVPGKLFEADD